MGFVTSLFLAVIVGIAALLVGVIVLPKRVDIPAHLLNHPLVELPSFLSKETMSELVKLTRSLKRIPPTTRDYDSYKVVHDSIGEDKPYDPVAKSCHDPFLLPAPDMKRCIFAGRFDVGRHFMMTGGVDGVKEPYDTLKNRLTSFMHYFFDYDKHEISKKLLSSPEFIKLAQDVCPPNKKLLDPIQLNLLTQVPGQSVAMHIDAPWFRHANRFQMPQWLLAVMVFSGLFQDDFIDQVQVVGYYHNRTNFTGYGGNFFMWNKEGQLPSDVLISSGGSANSVDGSKVIHAAAIYMPHRQPPPISNGGLAELVFRSEGGEPFWDIEESGKVIATYPESELRFSVVYRARCFVDEADKKKYYAERDDPTILSMEKVLTVLKNDLKKRNLLPDNISSYNLGILLLDTYIKYPLSPSAWIPYNYCLAPRLYPWLKSILAPFC